tara:strand:- start:277 stop:1347 length:1071 start_codon:yes stop_codon:yes gene_type:complete
MGRPLNKRYFANKDAGPTVAGNEIQVRFYDGTVLGAEGFIVKQRGTRKFVVSPTGTDDTTYDCVLVAGVEPHELTTGQMLIFVKADDDEVYTVSKITGHKATLVKNSAGNNIYDGKSLPWTFIADLTDGYVQIEEAGDNDIIDNTDTKVSEQNPLAPAKITGVILTAESTSTIQITFTAPNDNGFAINNYVVYVDGTVHATFDIGLVAFDELGRTVVAIGSLAEGTEYAIQVQALSYQGSSPISDSVSGTTNEAEPPAQITGVTLTVLGSTSIQINFTVPDDNGSAITYYTALVDGINHAAIAGVNLIEATPPPPVTLTGLTASTTYAIQLLANNDIGTGIPSVAVSAVTDTEAEG